MIRLVSSLVAGGVLSRSASSAGIRPALTRGLYTGVEHDTPLLLKESLGKTIGDTAAEDGSEERLREREVELGVPSRGKGDVTKCFAL